MIEGFDALIAAHLPRKLEVKLSAVPSPKFWAEGYGVTDFLDCYCSDLGMCAWFIRNPNIVHALMYMHIDAFQAGCSDYIRSYF